MFLRLFRSSPKIFPRLFVEILDYLDYIYNIISILFFSYMYTA